MTLPDFLTIDDGGYIHATGHRVGLHHVIRLYNEGYSAEMLALHYPTLSLALVHKLIAFYLENEAAVNEYMAGVGREIERQMAAAPPHPSLAELRERMAALHRVEAQPPATRTRTEP